MPFVSMTSGVISLLVGGHLTTYTHRLRGAIGRPTLMVGSGCMGSPIPAIPAIDAAHGPPALTKYRQPRDSSSPSGARTI